MENDGPTDEEQRHLNGLSFTLKHSEFPDAFDAMAVSVSEWAKKKGFWDRPKGFDPVSKEIQEWVELLEKATRIALLHSEASKLLEELRKTPKPNLQAHPLLYTDEEEELANAVIRIMDYAGHYGLRVGGALITKMQANFERVHRHEKRF